MLVREHEPDAEFAGLEVAALEWGDLHLDEPVPALTVRRGVWRGHVEPTKTYRERPVELPAIAVAALRDLPRVDRLVFSYRGGFVPYITALKKLHAASGAAGPRRISWHILRHTYITELGRRGAELHTIQELAGHSDIRTTRRYLKVLPEMRARAVSLLEPTVPRAAGGQEPPRNSDKQSNADAASFAS